MVDVRAERLSGAGMMTRPRIEQPCLICDSVWIKVQDGNDTGRTIFSRHYSHRNYADGRDPALFVGPGYKMVLLTPDARALFVWRKFKDDCIPPQTGVNCAVFRNESAALSSMLILEAEKFVPEKWPLDRRLYTYIDEKKIRHKRDPGRCFRKAGWKPCGHSQGGKLILEKFIGGVA